MCLCLGARRVIAVGGSSRDRAVLATYGSRVNCESGFLPYFVFFPVRSFDISAYILLLFLSFFSLTFFSPFFSLSFVFSFIFRRVEAVAFQGLTFPPSLLCFSGFVFVPS